MKRHIIYHTDWEIFVFKNVFLKFCALAQHFWLLTPKEKHDWSVEAEPGMQNRITKILEGIPKYLPAHPYLENHEAHIFCCSFNEFTCAGHQKASNGGNYLWYEPLNSEYVAANWVSSLGCEYPWQSVDRWPNTARTMRQAVLDLVISFLRYAWLSIRLHANLLQMPLCIISRVAEYIYWFM